MENVLQNDLNAISRIDAVNMILKTLTDMTGLSVSLVVRVTEDSWTACAVRDNMSFGIKSGDNLKLLTTY